MGGRRASTGLREQVARAAAARLPWDEFATESLELVLQAVGADAAILSPFDPVSRRVTGSVTREIPHGSYPAFAHHEYVEPDVGTFDELSRRRVPVSLLHADTGGDPQRSARHRDLLRPVLGLTHELRVAGLVRGRLWAGLSLMRGVGERPFDDREIAAVAAVGEVLASGMRASALQVATGSSAPGPAIVTVGPDGRPVGRSAGIETWFTLLDPGRSRLLPIAVVTAVAGARVAGEAEVTAVVPGAGPVRVQALMLSDGLVAVTVGQSTGPERAEHTARLLGLSDREREVALLSLTGASTRQIATTLRISEYTVQDHFRSIFRAAGVRSRAELGAVLRG